MRFQEQRCLCVALTTNDAPAAVLKFNTVVEACNDWHRVPSVPILSNRLTPARRCLSRFLAICGRITAHGIGKNLACHDLTLMLTTTASQ